MVSLIIDMRERGLMTELTTLNVAFTSGNLDVGDILIQAGGEPLLVAERKSHADFAASLADGRYREQRARLMATRGQGIAVLYILEGTWSAHVDRQFHANVTETQLQRLTSRLILRYGMPVLHTQSIRETAQWCQRLTDQLQADPEVFHPEKGLAAETAGAMATYTATFSTVKKGNKDVGGVAVGMLSATPGLGAKRVSALLAEQSIADLVALSATQIAALTPGGRKLGDKAGKTLFDALHHKG